jgi:hypothetical protein
MQELIAGKLHGMHGVFLLASLKGQSLEIVVDIWP